jgi:hypothetical protein
LTDQLAQDGARNYWKVLKKRLIGEGNELVTNCNRLSLVVGQPKTTGILKHFPQLFSIV